MTTTTWEEWIAATVAAGGYHYYACPGCDRVAKVIPVQPEDGSPPWYILGAGPGAWVRTVNKGPDDENLVLVPADEATEGEAAIARGLWRNCHTEDCPVVAKWG